MAQAISMSSSVSDQKSISSSCNDNQLKKQPGGTRNNFICRAMTIHEQNKPPTNIIHGGLLKPPQTYASLPIPFYGSYYQERQPPLLPLPPPQSIHASLPTRPHNLYSYSPASNRSRINRSSDQSLTPKKSKSKKPDKNQERRKSKEIDSRPAKGLVMESVEPSGPDPKHLPKDVPKVFLAPPRPKVVMANDFPGYLNELSGSVFTLAPPPSSLPLPKFSLRPKGSCNAEAAKIDPGAATNDLRRLLRLR